jgi:hypothetical protein
MVIMTLLHSLSLPMYIMWLTRTRWIIDCHRPSRPFKQNKARLSHHRRMLRQHKLRFTCPFPTLSTRATRSCLPRQANATEEAATHTKPRGATRHRPTLSLSLNLRHKHNQQVRPTHPSPPTGFTNRAVQFSSHATVHDYSIIIADPAGACF